MSGRLCIVGVGCSDGGISLPGTSRCRAHTRPGWGRHRPPANSYAYGSGWAVIRKQVLVRDGYRCQLRYDICVGRASQVDHIVQPEAGGSNDLENLRAVCKPCHARRTGRQGALAQRRRAAAKSRRK
jgi:5-methylcytosine-specific restriction protein A